MALPKRKMSRVRRDRRRAHYLRLRMPHMAPCAKCHTLKLSHHVCPNCGTYKGTQVLAQEDEG